MPGAQERVEAAVPQSDVAQAPAQQRVALADSYRTPITGKPRGR